jgi:dTDP-4-dehydrorhamnose reductase
VLGLLETVRPDVLIHCGGVCDVDACEADPEFTWAINVTSVGILLRHLPRSTRLVYCSSDHVFGAGGESLDESATPQAVSEYGRSRLAAEAQIRTERPDALVLRSGLAIGPSIDARSGHLDWLRYRDAKGLPMTLVEDEVRSAVWADDLASRIWAFSRSSITGLRHIVATRPASRPELATSLCRTLGIAPQFTFERREQRIVPHLGRVELETHFSDPLAEALPSAADPRPARASA